MTYDIHKKTFKIATIFVLAGVFLCSAVPTMVVGSNNMMSGSTSCQSMHQNLVGITPDGKLFGMVSFFLFTLLFVHSFSRRGENLSQPVSTALSPPPGSRWRLFQHAFFDTLYRQFSPERQYVAVVVEPQTYSV